AGVRDPRVPYWEPAKWVAKIRAMNTNSTRTVLVTNMSAGHFDVAGRFAGLEEVALIQAFALDVTSSRSSDDVLPGTPPAPEEALAPDPAPARAAAPERHRRESAGEPERAR